MTKLKNIIFVLLFILLANFNVLAENVELEVSAGKTAKMVNISESTEVDASVFLTESGYTTEDSKVAFGAGLAIKWAQSGYIDIDLKDEAIITKIEWSINYAHGARKLLTVYASNDENFSDSVTLGEVIEGMGTFSDENYYRYIRLSKASGFDFYPGQIHVYGYKKPFVFNGFSEGSVNTDTAIELTFSEPLSSDINVSDIKVTNAGEEVKTKIEISENKITVSPDGQWTAGGIYKLNIPSGTVIAQDTRSFDEDIVKYFAVSTDKLDIPSCIMENGILTLNLHDKTGKDISVNAVTVSYDDQNAVLSVSELSETISANGEKDIPVSVAEKSTVYFFEDTKNMKMLLLPFSNVWTKESTSEAGDILEAKYVDGQVVVSGNSSSGVMTAFLTTPDAELSASAIKAAKSTTVIGGKFVIKMVLDSKLASGDYAVWVSDGNADTPQKLGVYVLDEEDKQTYAEEIADMTAAELKTFFEDEKNGKILSGIGVLEKRPVDLTWLYSNIEQAELSGTYSEIAKAINTSIALAFTREKGIVVGISEYNEYLLVDVNEELYKKIQENELFDEAQTLMEKDYTDTQTFKEKLNNGFKLAIFTNSLSVEVATEFAVKNNTFFGFDFSGDYADLSSLDQKNVIYQAMKGSTLDDIKFKFNQAVEEYKKPVATSKPSGGGGGGGSSVPKVEVVLPEVKVDELKNDENSQKPVFDDLDESHWAYASIMSLADKDIVSGHAGKFNPQNNVTREEFVKMLVLSAGIDGDKENTFEDVKDGAWYYEYISLAKNNGIVSGISDTRFGVGENITRQDMAVMIYNTLKHLGKASGNEEPELSFDDSADISDYAKEAVSALCSINLINGRDNNRFEPDQNATRAEAAELICRLLNQIS